MAKVKFYAFLKDPKGTEWLMKSTVKLQCKEVLFFPQYWIVSAYYKNMQHLNPIKSHR